jgi:hypothetical protein
MVMTEHLRKKKNTGSRTNVQVRQEIEPGRKNVRRRARRNAKKCAKCRVHLNVAMP